MSRARRKAGWLQLLTRREESSWRALAEVMHELRRALNCQLELDADLSFVEFYALAWLSEGDDHRLAMTDLAVATNASLSRASHMVTRLEGMGYVQRERDPKDRRVTMATLTQTGQAKVMASAPTHVAALRQLFLDEFTAAELTVLQAMCERIVDRIEASEWKAGLV